MTEATFGVENGMVVCRVDGTLEFCDSLEHWEAAVLRLLDHDQSTLSDYVKNACIRIVREDSRGEGLVQILKESWRQEANLTRVGSKLQPPSWLSLDFNDAIWLTDAVRDSREFGIAFSPSSGHAWLAHRESGLPATAKSVVYEFDYFEGGQKGIGYGSYTNQADWRMEKAHRQCREVFAIMNFFGEFEMAQLLDVGSGYGFFRKACADFGWASEGVEISNLACRAAKEIFGLDTYCGTLDSFSKTCTKQFSVVVMWDFIEHVEDPMLVLELAQKLLSEDGFLFIRTPNLNAVEFEVFGASFHSLKREHLNLFSARSLSQCMFKSRIHPVATLSESHLLKGFRRSETPIWATNLRGSDLLAVGRNVRLQNGTERSARQQSAYGNAQRHRLHARSSYDNGK